MSSIEIKKNLSDKDKLDRILHYLQINISDFARELGVKADELYNLNNKKKKNFSKDLRSRIVKKYEIFDPDWINFGDGEMLKKDNSSQRSSVAGDNTGIIVQHGDNSTYNNNSDLASIVLAQQETISRQHATIDTLTETNRKQTEQIGKLIEMLSKYPNP